MMEFLTKGQYQISTLLVLYEGSHHLPVVDSPHKEPVTWNFDVSLMSAWTNFWRNSGVASDLRCHYVHVIFMDQMIMENAQQDHKILR